MSAPDDLTPEERAAVDAAMAGARDALTERHRDVIEVVEGLLARARSGRLEAVAVGYVMGRGYVGTAFAGQPETRGDLTYAVAHLARRVVEDPL